MKNIINWKVARKSLKSWKIYFVDTTLMLSNFMLITPKSYTSVITAFSTASAHENNFWWIISFFFVSKSAMNFMDFRCMFITWSTSQMTLQMVSHEHSLTPSEFRVQRGAKICKICKFHLISRAKVEKNWNCGDCRKAKWKHKISFSCTELWREKRKKALIKVKRRRRAKEEKSFRFHRQLSHSPPISFEMY